MNAEGMEAELKQIESVLSQIIGRPSRWSGRVELTAAPEIRGAKPFRCDIIIHQDLVGREERWRTLIHELLHSYSAGYNFPDYEAYRGREEDVIEQLQRLLRQTVFQQLGITLAEKTFEVWETDHYYVRFVTALENLRVALSLESGDFYLSLLDTPIRDRQSHVRHLGKTRMGSDYPIFIRLFAANNAILKTR